MSTQPGGQGPSSSADARLASISPLGRRRILITRPVDQADGLKAAIEARGGVPVAFPLIRIVPPHDMQAARATLGSIARYGIVIFVSRNAVARGLAILRTLAPDDAGSPIPANVHVLAVGAGTAADLVAEGVPANTVPGRRYDSEALLALDELGSGRIDRARVLIVKGEGGRDLLRRTLCERGAQVDTVAAYARQPPQAGATELNALWDEQPLDAIALTSVEAAQNLFALPSGSNARALRARLDAAAYAVVSERVRSVLTSLAPQARTTVARGANDEALADAVVELVARAPSSAG